MSAAGKISSHRGIWKNGLHMELIDKKLAPCLFATSWRGMSALKANNRLNEEFCLKPGRNHHVCWKNNIKWYAPKLMGWCERWNRAPLWVKNKINYKLTLKGTCCSLSTAQEFDEKLPIYKLTLKETCCSLSTTQEFAEKLPVYRPPKETCYYYF